ncbi:MAG: cytochrome c maturation protein CcmE [Caldilineaceae bacterium]|nr:cytochrome c maturation protein CcmE [Caldilineaceae bacterium]MCY3993658.1 cytochrome c maturation protein CcmE [Caldilineaceae bacterium]MDE0078403.1 cytochrome c maturation protein CcmE [Caldilineaceae bacterium]MDE0312894.1 cytochrome c maturation protein CcmE [Caldilineaceae bacterium]
MTEESPIQDELNEEELWDGPIPARLARKRTGIKPQFLVAGLLLVGVIISLMVYGLTTAKAYWLTVDEVHQKGDSLVSQRLRVNGVVVEGSEDWNAEEVTLRFKIEDEENPGRQLSIVHYEPRPDNFHRAASVIVEGELLQGGVIEADVLLLKCPSRYEESPEDILLQAAN